MPITTVTISPEQFARTNVYWAQHYRRLYWRGLLLRQKSDFFDRYRSFTAKKQSGPLSPDEVAWVTALQRDEDNNYAQRSIEMDVTRDIIPENAETLSTRYRFAFILQEFLHKNPSVRTIANIGARVDVWSAYLARRFPNRTFISVDFQNNLALHNSLLPQAPNWTFLTGYWLDLMRSGTLRADMYFSLSTVTLMNNKELNVYLDTISGHAKAFAISENWYARADSFFNRVVRPEQVPKERPYCSGEYANYHHNYVAKLQERRFKIELSQIVPFSEAFHYLQIIASRAS